MRQLYDVLKNIGDNKVIFTLENLLVDEKKITRSSSWGRHVIHIEGYEGSISLDDLGQRYLDVPAKMLWDRCGELKLLEIPEDRVIWGKFKKLYKEAEATKTCAFQFFRGLTLLKQRLFRQKDPQTIFNTWQCIDWRLQFNKTPILLRDT